MIWKMYLKDGERLKCDHCTHVIEGADYKDVRVYIEKGQSGDNALGRVSCESCYELQTSDESGDKNE